jgi:hypothetical protein
MNPHFDTAVIAALDATREALYRLADRDPALSDPLSDATLSITSALNAVALGTATLDDAADALLSALNLIASTRDNPRTASAVQLELAALFADLAPLPRLLRSVAAPPRRHLRLVHSH